MRNIMTAFIVVFMTITAAATNGDYMASVCLNDSTGRTVTLYAQDTSVTLKNVTYVEHNASGYSVTYKDGTSVVYRIPGLENLSKSILDKLSRAPF